MFSILLQSFQTHFVNTGYAIKDASVQVGLFPSDVKTITLSVRASCPASPKACCSMPPDMGGNSVATIPRESGRSIERMSYFGLCGQIYLTDSAEIHALRLLRRNLMPGTVQVLHAVSNLVCANEFEVFDIVSLLTQMKLMQIAVKPPVILCRGIEV